MILLYLIAINILTFLVFGFDKYRARHHQWRVSESTLFAYRFWEVPLELWQA